MIRIGIAGIDGRMGREIVAAAADVDDLVVIGGLDKPNSARLLYSPEAIRPVDFFDLLDVLIDFSTPAAVPGYAAASAAIALPYVCGVTGLNAAQLGALHRAAEKTQVFYARNMSVGIAAILAFLPDLARRLGSYDAEIVELHHRRKVDAPSGTALALAEAITAGRGRELDQPQVHGRSGRAPRTEREIGMHAVRGGANAGEHTVLFAGDGEEIRIEHRALSRAAFADGAIRAARFIVRQEDGFYQMADLLGGD
jgi:4-hydroxy-tetrahydrodipicolinate reductase